MGARIRDRWVWLSVAALVLAACPNPLQPLVQQDVFDAVNDPDLSLTGPDGETIPAGTGTCTFDGTLVGHTREAIFTITNSGTQVLEITAIEIDEDPGGAFTVTQEPASTVAPGETTDFIITFAPDDEGVFNATVRIESTDPDENPCAFVVEGVATLVPEPDIRVKGPTGFVVSAGGSVVIESTEVGDTRATVFTIENLGTADLELTGDPTVLLSGADAARFSLSEAPAAVVAASGETTFEIAYTPVAAGTDTVQLRIDTNDPDEDPFLFEVEVEATPPPAPEIRVEKADASTIAPGSTYTLPVTAVSSTRVVVITIRNTGDADLHLTGTPRVDLTNVVGSGLSRTQPGADTIAPDDSTTFTLVFSPTSAGTTTADVTIANDDDDENPFVFEVSAAAAVAPEMDVVDDVSDPIASGGGYNIAGTTQVGATTEVTFTIENNGSDDLTLSGGPVSISGTHASDYTVSAQPASSTVTAGNSETFTIDFVPLGYGAREATVTIGNNDGDENPYTFELSGTGHVGDLRITTAGDDSQLPALAWSGAEYAIAWQDERDGDFDTFAVPMSSGGAKVAADLRLVNAAGITANASIAWNGTDFGVAWSDPRDTNSEVYFARMTTSGALVGPPVSVTGPDDNFDSSDPSLVWTGTEYGMAWSDTREGNAEVYFGFVDSDGAMSDVLRVTEDASWSGLVSLVWTGSGFGVAWLDQRDGWDEVYFTRISGVGDKVGGDIAVTTDDDTDSSNPSLAWTGSGYGVAWHDARDGSTEIYFAVLNGSGVKQGSDVRVSDAAGISQSPSLSWTGSQFGVAWHDARDGNNEIYFTRISSAGSEVGDDLRITDATGSSQTPWLVSDGSGFGLAWSDNRMLATNYEIYFTILSSTGVKR